MITPVIATTGHMLVAGMDLNGVMAELTSRAARLTRQGRLDAHVLGASRFLRRPHGIVSQVSSAPALAFSPTSTRRTATSPSPISATVRPTRASLRELQHGRALGLPVVYVVKQPVRHGWRLSAPRPKRTSTAEVTSTSRQGKSTGWTLSPCATRASEAAEHAGLGRAFHPRDEDLPLPRPLHERPTEIPHARKSTRCARTVMTD